ncbi:hypothetical protein [Labilibaculum sp.]|uniref:hypothetical protein n=1 Tax=Labilibaculum sp. TaxID=2060723 RepID=UPI0035670B07
MVLQCLQQNYKHCTLSVVRNRGTVNQADLEAFFAAGYKQRHISEIILGLSQKVISNYTNRVAETPVDTGLKKIRLVYKIIKIQSAQVGLLVLINFYP